MLIKGNTGTVNVKEVPPNQAFLASLCNAIEEMDMKCGKKPSTSYTPSGMNCIRNMWYKRRGVVMDKEPMLYSDISAADTGTRRHEAIQEVLQYMTDNNSRFLYIDVETYVKKRQEQGRCLQLVVTGKQGAETSLWDRDRNVKFRCDGIIYDKLTKQFYLFEFKNQISFKAAGKQCVDKAHHCQVICYCMELDLEQAFVTYENRDELTLYVPEIFKVSEYDKQMIKDKLDECEYKARHGIVPARPTNLSASDCRYCRYKSQCKQDGKDEHEWQG